MNLTNFEKQIGFSFKNQDLLKQAFIHRSYLNEFKKRENESNERLEFLGDAVLSFVVSSWLFEDFPAYPEGKLTSLRSNMVNTEALAKIAIKLKIGDFLLLSRGEKEAQGQNNPTLLANALEAVIGALFLDQGLEAVKNFIGKNFQVILEQTIRSGRLKDYKSLLQEKAQAQTNQSPVYKIIKEEGPEHSKVFTVDVLIQGDILSQGVGKSKQKAEQQAAQKALENLALKK